ncbi:hypothetical protein ACFUN7_13270 [Streptomyces sp. NPDC057236]|uniref:hypothetical protein n=1 Tax=Streptomyces sp. NPDC057236 TaxID=3346059 RepID=UPI00362FA95C
MGSGFSGIDPDKLEGTINSLQKDQERLRSSATWIKSSFERYGIDAAPLTELLAIAGWAENQLPSLRRRWHLALAETKKYGYKNMVQIDESKVGQTAQSRANGKKLAGEFQKKLDDGDSITPELFADLRANKADADYLKAFYETLGSRRLLWLSNDMGDRFNDQYKDHPEQREKDRLVIAETFGSFTKVAFEGKTTKEKQRLWNKWFDDSAMDEYDGFRPDRLTPFLKGGNHDKDFLVAFGDRVFKKDTKTNETRFFGNGGLGEGEWGKDSYQQLFSAIGDNPEAAGEWFDHNNEFALKALYSTGPWKVDEPKERGKAFFELLNAATVELKQENPSLAEKNTAHILFDNYQHRTGSDTKSLHPIGGTQALYASIIAAYWKDLEHGVTSPVSNSLWGSDVQAKGEEKFGSASKWNLNDFLKGQDSGRPGLEANEKLWRALMEESARDPQAAGTLSALFQAYNEKAIDQSYATRESGEYAGSYASMQRGMMQEFYQTTMKVASTELETSIDKWVEGTNNARAAVIDTAASVAAGAAGGAGLAGVKGAAVGVAYGLGQDVFTGWIKDLIKVDANDAPKGLKEQFEGVKKATADFSWQNDYQTNASSAWEYGRIENVTVVTHGENGETRTAVYTGDPRAYAKGAGDFLDKDGQILDVSKMTNAQRTAYSDWLQDPAVVNAVWPEFSTGRDGRDYPGQDQ